ELRVPLPFGLSLKLNVVFSIPNSLKTYILYLWHARSSRFHVCRIPLPLPPLSVSVEVESHDKWGGDPRIKEGVVPKSASVFLKQHIPSADFCNQYPSAEFLPS